MSSLMEKVSCKDEEIFNKWLKSRNIDKYLETYCSWRKVTKKGLRCSVNERLTEDRFPLRDHVTLWRDKQGKKVLVSQPYAYYPGDMKSCFAPPNIYYDKDSEATAQKKFDKLKDWCKERNLEVRFYPSTESWYYPFNTILIEIREIES